MRSKHIQVIGFIIIIALFWHFGGSELVAITATVVAIWEFLKPSHI